jgi:hypothetical protein
MANSLALRQLGQQAMLRFDGAILALAAGFV